MFLVTANETEKESERWAQGAGNWRWMLMTSFAIVLYIYNPADIYVWSINYSLSRRSSLCALSLSQRPRSREPQCVCAMHIAAYYVYAAVAKPYMGAVPKITFSRSLCLGYLLLRGRERAASLRYPITSECQGISKILWDLRRKYNLLRGNLNFLEFNWKVSNFESLRILESLFLWLVF